MKSFLFLAVLSFSTSSWAHDSTWSLCRTETTLFEQSETLILNKYEHRNITSDGRDTDFVLIFGGNILSGKFDSSTSSEGKLILSSENSFYYGKVILNDSDDKVQLDGVLSLQGSETKLNTTFSCEVLRN